MSRYRAIAGHQPWTAPASVEQQGRGDAAPQQETAYTCSRGGHRFTVSFAAAVTPPPAWDCRCGGTGRLNGNPEDASPEDSGADDSGITPWGQLMKRRTIPELEQMLAERLAQVRGTA